MQTLAKESLVSRRTVYNWFMSGLGDDAYHDLVTEVLISRVADADADLEVARMSGDPVQVSGAREACRFYRMDLERRRPGLYGAKPVNVNIAAVTADAGLTGAAGDLLKLVATSARVLADRSDTLTVEPLDD